MHRLLLPSFTSQFWVKYCLTLFYSEHDSVAIEKISFWVYPDTLPSIQQVKASCYKLFASKSDMKADRRCWRCRQSKTSCKTKRSYPFTTRQSVHQGGGYLRWERNGWYRSRNLCGQTYLICKHQSAQITAVTTSLKQVLFLYHFMGWELWSRFEKCPVWNIVNSSIKPLKKTSVGQLFHLIVQGTPIQPLYMDLTNKNGFISRIMFLQILKKQNVHLAEKCNASNYLFVIVWMTAETIKLMSASHQNRKERNKPKNDEWPHFA